MEKPTPERIGLCLGCRHARRVETPRALYWLCELSASDPRFERYPRLPVRSCDGFEPREEPGVSG
jgi:hypothetical protein